MVTLSNFPLLWLSNIQTEIVLYTLHSEYVVSSHSVRYLLTLNILIKEVIDNLEINSNNLKFVLSSTVYEENNVAIVFSICPRITPSSNHISVKYNWIRQHVGN